MYTTLLAVHWEQITMASSSIVYSTISGKIVLWFFLLVRSLLNFCFAIFFLCCFIGRFQVRRLCRPCHIVSITTPRVDHQASLAAEASFPCNNHDWFVFKLMLFFLVYIIFSSHHMDWHKLSLLNSLPGEFCLAAAFKWSREMEMRNSKRETCAIEIRIGKFHFNLH